MVPIQAKKSFGAILILLLGQLVGGGAPPPEVGQLPEADRKLFNRALALHQMGVQGDRHAVVEALAGFAALAGRHPEDPVVLAFYGSTSTLRARDAIFYRKMEYLRTGLENLDRAVALAPGNCHVRAIRAINNYQLPSFVGRKSLAHQDFARLYDQFRQTAAAAPPEWQDLRRFTLYHGGLFALREERPEAVSFFELALASPSQLVSDQELESRLREARRLLANHQSGQS